MFFYTQGQLNLANYDAITRLNIARKMIDSLTPGVGQLGGVWLPFPQVIMGLFVWNDFMWHSGVAGYIISGLSFVFGAVFLQKAAYAITRERKISLLIWFLFVTNSNILFLQSMAMSELFSLCCLILSLYFLIIWVTSHDLLAFLQAAFFVMLLTLTRYEGYFVLGGASLVVLIESIRSFRREGRAKIEGMLLLFLIVAGFGVVLWCLYSALFYKDPFYWLHTYSTTGSSIIQGGQKIIDDVYGVLNPNIMQSLTIFSGVVLWTNGVIITILGLVGFVFYLLRPTRYSLPVAIISGLIFALMVVGYSIGFIPHIEFPTVLLTGARAREWSLYADNNIRYGMILLPSLLLFTAFLAKKHTLFYYGIIGCVVLQLGLLLINPQWIQYDMSESWRYPIRAEVPWFRSHYDGGLVLISSARHEDFIFQSRLPYKRFIYEGTRDYWKDSLKDPSKYAKWVIYNNAISGDGVTDAMTREGYSILKKKFKLVYDWGGMKIYRIK